MWVNLLDSTFALKVPCHSPVSLPPASFPLMSPWWPWYAALQVVGGWVLQCAYNLACNLGTFDVLHCCTAGKLRAEFCPNFFFSYNMKKKTIKIEVRVVPFDRFFLILPVGHLRVSCMCDLGNRVATLASNLGVLHCRSIRPCTALGTTPARWPSVPRASVLSSPSRSSATQTLSSQRSSTLTPRKARVR